MVGRWCGTSRALLWRCRGRLVGEFGALGLGVGELVGLAGGDVDGCGEVAEFGGEAGVLDGGRGHIGYALYGTSGAAAAFEAAALGLSEDGGRLAVWRCCGVGKASVRRLCGAYAAPWGLQAEGVVDAVVLDLQRRLGFGPGLLEGPLNVVEAEPCVSEGVAGCSECFAGSGEGSGGLRGALLG